MYGADTYNGGDNANNRETTFTISSTKLCVPIVNLSTEDNVNLTKQLNKRFKRSVYWNEYKSKIESKNADDNVKRFNLDASFKGVKRLFVSAFNNNGGPGRVQRESQKIFPSKSRYHQFQCINWWQKLL